MSKQQRLVERLIRATETMVQGGLSETSRCCGNPSCACYRDPKRLHGPHLYITYREDDKSRSLYVPPEHAATARKAQQAWGAFWEIGCSLAKLNRDGLRKRGSKRNGRRRRLPGESPMIEARRQQLRFGDGFIAEEVSDLQEVWMKYADQASPYICLDKHMLCGVYQESGICFRNHCGAEPPRYIEPPGLVPTVGGRDRASASYAAADRVKAPASAARGWFRGIHGGRTAPSLPAEARTASGGGCLAGSVPPVLVRSRGCSRTPPRPHGSVNTNEKEDKEKTTRPKPRT
jgi:Family of unknown function (DUF6788)